MKDSFPDLDEERFRAVEHVGGPGCGSGRFVGSQPTKEIRTRTGPRDAASRLVLEDYRTHASKTMMLSELSLLLEAVPHGPLGAYREAVLEQNVLLKGIGSTREKSLKHLRELYVLDERDVPFDALRTLWRHDPASLPLLALLAAVTRDGLLRSTMELVLQTPAGASLNAGMFSEVVSEAFPDRMSRTTLDSVGQRTASSWTQSGHLRGRMKKVRAAAPAGVPVGAVVYALMLGHLSGVRGLLLYETPWARLLDAPPNALDDRAFAASQRGLLEYRRMGDVAEFGFSKLLGGDRD